jgi:hypothetical protein
MNIPSLDPFIRVSDESFLISQHLKFEELLKISEVSVDWCELMSKQIVKKAQLNVKINHSNSDCNVNKIVQESSRQYKNLKIISNHQISLSLIEKFSSSLESLNLSSFSKAAGHATDEIFMLPKLKCLTIFNLPIQQEKFIIKCVKASNVQLEELEISHQFVAQANHENTMETMKFISQQRKLKRLDLQFYKMRLNNQSDEISSLFNDEIVNFKELKEFSFTTPTALKSTIFLSKMRNLETLTVNNIRSTSELKFIINCLPKLKELRIDISTIEGDFKLEFNFNIVKISFTDFQSEKIYEKVFKSLKELKFLECNDILSVDLLKIIVENLLKLEKMTFVKVQKEILNHYKKMKQEKININKNIQILGSVKES